MDKIRYEIYQKDQFERFEDICKRCGECCGSRDEDACANLSYDDSTGQYYCKDYKNRVGPQKTIRGNIFACVPIGDIMNHGYLRPSCAYNKIL